MTDWFDFSAHLDSGSVLAIISQKDADHSGTSLAEHRVRLAAERGLAVDLIAVPNQVHGNRVEIAKPGQIHQQTDGLITDNPEVILSLQVADCSPVFMYHKPTGTRGLVHAGWRGLAAGILARATDMLKSMEIRPEEVQVFIGPTIEADCYEVGEEVAVQFSSELCEANSNGRYQFDLVATSLEQLHKAGIPERHMHRTDICTYCDSRCHSYRREGHRAGRMIAFFSTESIG
jgi:YfiH family protein